MGILDKGNVFTCLAKRSFEYVEFCFLFFCFARFCTKFKGAGCHQAGRDTQVAKNQRNFTNYYMQIGVSNFPWQEDVDVNIG